MTTAEELPALVSVSSSFGHRFMPGADGEDDYGNAQDSCLVCGALYQLTRRADDPATGDYTAANGADPMECSRDTGMAHGYPGERYCHEHTHPRDDDPDHECRHTQHDCNCLLCL